MTDIARRLCSLAKTVPRSRYGFIKLTLPPFRGGGCLPSCCPALQRACGNHSGEAERSYGMGLKLFGFIPEPVFTFNPESCSGSSRSAVRNQPGIAFTLPRIPHHHCRLALHHGGNGAAPGALLQNHTSILDEPASPLRPGNSAGRMGDSGDRGGAATRCCVKREFPTRRLR